MTGTTNGQRACLHHRKKEQRQGGGKCLDKKDPMCHCTLVNGNGHAQGPSSPSDRSGTIAKSACEIEGRRGSGSARRGRERDRQSDLNLSLSFALFPGHCGSDSLSFSQRRAPILKPVSALRAGGPALANRKDERGPKARRQTQGGGGM